MAMSIPVIITAFLPTLSDSQPKKTKNGVPRNNPIAIRESTWVVSMFITFCIKLMA